jgi:hypothetical protein
VLLDMTSVSFCDARRLSDLIRIANHADDADWPYGLIAPRPQVAKGARPVTVAGRGTCRRHSGPGPVARQIESEQGRMGS